MAVVVKEEPLEPLNVVVPCEENRQTSEIPEPSPVAVAGFCTNDSSDSDDDSVDSSMGMGDDPNGVSNKKSSKYENLGIVLPVGFLEPLVKVDQGSPKPQNPQPRLLLEAHVHGCKQFWKAGDYDGCPVGDGSPSFGGMDHVRVHPKFLHSNATSHKWALGAFAELLDNSIDEIANGATFVNVDMLENKKDGSRMLLFEDDGGGMCPKTMRHCMSLGYSAKSKSANTIGQYGNGFKTSTMRLGADVIVFSRFRGKDGSSPTQSIGLLSYTFLKSTGKEDTVVPMLDYEKQGQTWSRIVRSSTADWDRNVETVVDWSPYSSEGELLNQFNMMKDHGTRVIIYNLWEDDGGELELDFDADPHDIQIRGGNRDPKKIEMAKQFPNSRHFLTYRHSLRSYSSILYLKLPPGFRLILRGKDVEHHNIVNDMMMTQEITYKPSALAEGAPKDPNMIAVVTIGFVKDAKDHIDVQGFNVYHKNRLVKPFWRIWNPAGSDGRGAIGVLEANFVEPAHDKQGFERTAVLSRLEARLIQIQKTFWSSNCHEIGYAPRVNKRHANGTATDGLAEPPSSQRAKKSKSSCKEVPLPSSDKRKSGSTHVKIERENGCGQEANGTSNANHNSISSFSELPLSSVKRVENGTSHDAPIAQNSDVHRDFARNGRMDQAAAPFQLKPTDVTFHGSRMATCNLDAQRHNYLESENQELRNRLWSVEQKLSLDLQLERDRCKLLEDELELSSRSPSKSDVLLACQLKAENQELKDRLDKLEQSLSHDLHLERERCISLEAKLEEANAKIAELDKESEALIEIFSEERNRRDAVEHSLRIKVQDASSTIQELVNKVVMLQRMKTPQVKQEQK